MSSSRSQLEFLEAKDDFTYRFIADFLANKFCQQISEEEKYLYNETIAIAKVHLQNVYGNKFSGLFYPTVQLNAEEENFAINKATIDHGLLDCERVEFIEVINKVANRYKYRIIDVAENIDSGVIIWENLNRQWTVFDDSEDLNFVKEDGQAIAYDKDAEVIEPD